ncbi:hypothetical protein CAPTEDRAFT_96626 [Capitella teleta]|uniref:TIR domain-containing protein n=1 Tax=Capitella teleta TaxID=283909 RepID=R7UTD3_CAPTE|nr:hypothetical protein CAPTEDRAFT_96626 [Capitella teleta]|eukprot:ELU06636.1 hypothetical protein CAPTEDRAFT_96626 [Capitella teleta]
MFQNITTLRTLDLTEIKVPRTSIHRRTFFGLHHLKILSLANFGLRDADPDVFHGLQSLRTLNLKNNELRILNASSFPLHFLQNITKLNLANNPFECSCELFWFKNWINENKKKLISYRDNPSLYRCASPPSKYGTRLLDLTLSPDDCISKPLNSYVWVTFGLSSFQLLVTLLISIVYRLRWHLRLWSFHLATWMRSRWHKRPERQENFKFDLFVSHNSCDASWVKNVLLPELEERSQPPFKLCVYSRNWLAGSTISDCIIESLALSRKTLLLVTNAFAKSEWCQFEMTMAQHRLIETDNDNVVLAVMEDIEPMNLNPRLRLMMKRKIYLAWTDDPVGQLFFWESLKQLLRSDGRSLVESTPSADELRSVLG